MNTLEQHLFDRISAALRQIPREEASDIFALWFFLSLLEEDGMRPEVLSLTWSTQQGVTPERAKEYGSRWSAWASTGERVLRLLDAERDPAGWQLLDDFYQSLLKDDTERLAWEGATLRAQLYDENGSVERSEAEKQRLAEVREQLRQMYPDEQKARRFAEFTCYSYIYVPFDLPEVFLPLLGNVIRELHTQNVVREACGRDVPIGIAATNDVGYEFGLETTRQANPAGLSRAMEEWMMGESYETIAAREQHHQEIAAWPAAEQARYWVQLRIDVETHFHHGPCSALLEELKTRKLFRREPNIFAVSVHISEQLKRLLPLTAPLMVDAIEQHATNELPTPFRAVSSDKPDAGAFKTNDIAVALLLELESAAKAETRDAVPDEVVERLHAVLRRLWDDAPRHERTGATLQCTARALRALRPERFPPARHDGARLFNAQEFDLPPVA